MADEPWFNSPQAGAVEIMPHMPTAPANTKNYVLMNPSGTLITTLKSTTLGKLGS